MEARINVIALAVGDLDRAVGFYREGLGLATSGVTGTDYEGDQVTPAGTVVMFHMAGGVVLALHARSELAKDANIPFGPPKTGEFSIGHIVPQRADVDALLEQAIAAAQR